mmetsp:Transcript_17685/g.38929  ORF Transcript_17685/g.38929 Transcript_17685/m.38929 type:complete len:233 (+) Transcript_17685:87-785(+)
MRRTRRPWPHPGPCHQQRRCWPSPRPSSERTAGTQPSDTALPLPLSVAQVDTDLIGFHERQGHGPVVPGQRKFNLPILQLLHSLGVVLPQLGGEFNHTLLSVGLISAPGEGEHSSLKSWHLSQRDLRVRWLRSAVQGLVLTRQCKSHLPTGIQHRCRHGDRLRRLPCVQHRRRHCHGLRLAVLCLVLRGAKHADVPGELHKGCPVPLLSVVTCRLRHQNGWVLPNLVAMLCC